MRVIKFKRRVKNMKKIFLLIIVTVLVMIAGTAQAVLFMTSDGVGAGKLSLTGDFGLPTSGVTEVGAKLSYGFTKDIDGYGRLVAQSSFGSTSTWLGAGAKGLFMKAADDLPVDLAWLGDLSYFHQNSVQTLSLIGGLVASKKLDAKWTPYGLLGLSYSSQSTSLPIGSTSIATSTGLVLCGGASYAWADNLNLKAELMFTAASGTSNTGCGAALEYKL
jgi:hypothetical protein